MPKSLTRGPARLLVLAVALGGPLAVVDTASAAGNQVPTEPTLITAQAAGPGTADVDWEASMMEDEPVEDEPVEDDPVDDDPIDDGDPCIDDPMICAIESGDTSGDDTGDMGGESIAYYEVGIAGVGGGVDEESVKITKDNTSDFSYGNGRLDAGRYTFAVRAVDGDGETSEWAYAEEPTDVYSLAPTDVKLKRGKTGEAAVSWVAPTVPNDQPQVASYDVSLYKYDSGKEEYVLVDSDQTGAGDSKTTFDGLRSGSYQAIVEAIDSDDNREQASSDAEGVEIPGYDAPDSAKVGFAQQVSGAGGRVYVSFDPGDDRGFEVDRYEVVLVKAKHSSPDDDSLKIVAADGPVTANGELQSPFSTNVNRGDDYNATFTDVPAGSYYALVFTHYLDDEGEADTQGPTAEDDAKLVKVVEVPNRAQNVSATKTSATSIRLTWQGPVAKDGVAVTGYRIGVSGPQASGYFNVPAGTTSHVFDNLEPGTYFFGVTAMVSEDLGGDFTEAQPVVIDQAAPAKGAPVVTAKGGAVESGEKATIAGTAAKGQVLQLQLREVSSNARTTADGFTVAGKTKANKKGRYVFKQKFTRNVEVRVVNLTTGAVSPTSTVIVAKDVKVRASRVGKRSYRIAGKVAPAGAGQVVSLLVKQGGSFVQVAQTTTGKKGTYSFRHTFAGKGKAVVQVVSAASKTNGAGSQTRTFKVR